MATARLQNASSNDNVHTKETILAKLDTDLTDAERKSYLNILLESPDTTHLLTIVALEWEIKLLEQQKKILTLKESIRIKNCYIDSNKKHRTFDSSKKN